MVNQVGMDSLDFSKLEDLEKELHKATVEITFWGARVVRFESGLYIKLDTLARMALRASYQYSEDNDVTREQRVAGIKISERLIDFYKCTDKAIKEFNFFTRFLCFFREFFSSI
jgi:hypothetical protein